MGRKVPSVGDIVKARAAWNGARFRPRDPSGHYESWFLRANHPTRPQAFWIRYTIFVPKGRPEEAEGERWAIWFDGERDEVVASRDEVPIARCGFRPDALDVTIGDGTLGPDGLRGAVGRVAWDLRCRGEAPPLVFLPEPYYERRLPKAKAVVPVPFARFDGTLMVDGAAREIDGWVGSQNHNWGSQHTDRYAWAQVAGFDDAPDAFLECITARVRLGPLWTPPLTIAVLRLGERTIPFNRLAAALRGRGEYAPFEWSFAVGGGGRTLTGRIEAPAEHFVGLPYRNPPGGTLTCLNCKIAAAEVTFTEGGRSRTLRTAHRAAFEILTERAPPGVRMAPAEAAGG